MSRFYPSAFLSVRAGWLALAALGALHVAGGTTAARATPAAATLQELQTLQLSAAPVRFVSPADRGQWALRLAGI